MSSRLHQLRRVVRDMPLARRLSTAPANKNVLDELKSRGFIQAVTSNDLTAHLDSPSCVYAGVDPSASSLHVGNLLPLIGLLHFRARGHHALALVGGATGSIGDPSGRSTERNALSPEELAHNVAGITSQVETFFERGITYAAKWGYDIDPEAAQRGRGFDVVNNHDWFKNVSFLDFLRDVGKLARVNAMLARDSVKSRLDSEQGISFTEFSYQLLQAHDFATLFKERGCRVQLGGSDQWGNIVAGIDMIKRVRAQEAAEVARNEAAEAAAAEAENKTKKGKKGAAKVEVDTPKVDTAKANLAAQIDPAFGLTMPLLTTSTGEKFGKSAGNAVWIDPSRTSIPDFYQFFYRSNDADVGKYLSLLTLVPPEQIRTVMKGHEQDPRARSAQRLLAEQVTELVHGPEGVRRAQVSAQILYGQDPRKLKSADVLAAMEGDRRFVRVKRRDIKGLPVTKLAVMHGLVNSRNEATRLVGKSNKSGMYLNETPVNDPRREITRSDLIDKHLAILRRGQRDMIVFYVEYED